MSQEAYDIVIVGAGAAGCVVASSVAGCGWPTATRPRCRSSNPNFIGDEEDLKAAVESVRAIREVMAQESLAPVIEEEMDPGPHIQSDAEIGEWVKRVVTTM